MLGWNNRALAGRLHCNTHLPTNWADGTEPAPVMVPEWLFALVDAARDNPQFTDARKIVRRPALHSFKPAMVRGAVPAASG